MTGKDVEALCDINRHCRGFPLISDGVEVCGTFGRAVCGLFCCSVFEASKGLQAKAESSTAECMMVPSKQWSCFYGSVAIWGRSTKPSQAQ